VREFQLVADCAICCNERSTVLLRYVPFTAVPTEVPCHKIEFFDTVPWIDENAEEGKQKVDEGTGCISQW